MKYALIMFSLLTCHTKYSHADLHLWKADYPKISQLFLGYRPSLKGHTWCQHFISDNWAIIILFENINWLYHPRPTHLLNKVQSLPRSNTFSILFSHFNVIFYNFPPQARACTHIHFYTRCIHTHVHTCAVTAIDNPKFPAQSPLYLGTRSFLFFAYSLPPLFTRLTASKSLPLNTNVSFS